MYFDRFDICEAYLAIEMDYSFGGWLQERDVYDGKIDDGEGFLRKRKDSIHVQVHRCKYRPSPLFKGYDSLNDNGREIYHALERRFNLVDAAIASHADQEWSRDVEISELQETEDLYLQQGFSNYN